MLVDEKIAKICLFVACVRSIHASSPNHVFIWIVPRGALNKITFVPAWRGHRFQFKCNSSVRLLVVNPCDFVSLGRKGYVLFRPPEYVDVLPVHQSLLRKVIKSNYGGLSEGAPVGPACCWGCSGVTWPSFEQGVPTTNKLSAWSSFSSQFSEPGFWLHLIHHTESFFFFFQSTIDVKTQKKLNQVVESQLFISLWNRYHKLLSDNELI